MIRQVICSICHVNTIGFLEVYHSGLANHPYVCSHCIVKAHAQMNRWGFGKGHPFYDWLVAGTPYESEAHNRSLKIPLDIAYQDMLRSVLAAKRKIT